jgi:hypothetical protein
MKMLFVDEVEITGPFTVIVFSTFVAVKPRYEPVALLVTEIVEPTVILAVPVARNEEPLVLFAKEIVPPANATLPVCAYMVAAFCVPFTVTVNSPTASVPAENLRESAVVVV